MKNYEAISREINVLINDDKNVGVTFGDIDDAQNWLTSGNPGFKTLWVKFLNRYNDALRVALPTLFRIAAELAEEVPILLVSTMWPSSEGDHPSVELKPHVGKTISLATKLNNVNI